MPQSMSSLTETSTSNALRHNLDSSLTSRIPMRFALQYSIASHNTGRSSFFFAPEMCSSKTLQTSIPLYLHTPTSPWPVFPCSVCHQYWRHERILLLLSSIHNGMMCSSPSLFPLSSETHAQPLASVASIWPLVVNSKFRAHRKNASEVRTKHCDDRFDSLRWSTLSIAMFCSTHRILFSPRQKVSWGLFLRL